MSVNIEFLQGFFVISLNVWKWIMEFLFCQLLLVAFFQIGFSQFCDFQLSRRDSMIESWKSA